MTQHQQEERKEGEEEEEEEASLVLQAYRVPSHWSAGGACSPEESPVGLLERTDDVEALLR